MRAAVYLSSTCQYDFLPNENMAVFQTLPTPFWTLINTMIFTFEFFEFFEIHFKRQTTPLNKYMQIMIVGPIDLVVDLVTIF